MENEINLPSYRALVVSKTLVKQVKDALDNRGWLNKRIKIKPIPKYPMYRLEAGKASNVQEGNFYVPLKDLGDGGASSPELELFYIAQKKSIEISIIKVLSAEPKPVEVATSKMNPLARTIQQWLLKRTVVADAVFGGTTSDVKDVLNFSWPYIIYPPLLLLPPTFASDLSIISADYSPNAPVLDVSSLYPMVCSSLGVSHIALSAPIPKDVSTAIPDRCSDSDPREYFEENPSRPNTLRSPAGFTPVHGDFGPALPEAHRPTADDFALAFWCTVKQNSIFQTWAPRYVMFSRGNISEKARLLKLDSLNREGLGTAPEEISAVDLYAGIGYFAFSYAKAGVSKVLCWEINPWSVEALSRGAKGNGWGARIMGTGENYDGSNEDDVRFLVFTESNEHATRRINALRSTIPPIKHVNCGYLPSSEASWETAVRVLDPLGGWIHAHENVAQKDIEARRDEIVQKFTDLVNKSLHKSLTSEYNIECEHVERVKSYAPGVIHCVFDIAIMPNHNI